MDFVKAGRQKKQRLQIPPSRSTPAPAALQSLLRFPPPLNDSGLDKSGIDASSMSCGSKLWDESFATPLAQEDGNFSLLSYELSPQLANASPPVADDVHGETYGHVVDEVADLLAVGSDGCEYDGTCESVMVDECCSFPNGSAAPVEMTAPFVAPVDVQGGTAVTGASVDLPLMGAAFDDVDVDDDQVNVSLGCIPQVDGLESKSHVNKSFSSYPTFLCTNARSLIPKMDFLCSVIEQENVDIGFISELWLDGCT